MRLLVGFVFMVSCSPSEDRVGSARKASLARVKAIFASRGVPYPPASVYLRAVKAERTLELWAGKNGTGYRLVKSYPVAAMSGRLGPKLRGGDRQVPEGLYRVDRFNPRSAYHLSLGINYPNARDLARNEPRPGGDIFIHGGAASIGCLAMTDPAIEEIYLAALDSRSRPIPVHIFPTRMEGGAYLRAISAAEPNTRRLWRSLEPAWTEFEKTRSIPTWKVSNGEYVFGG